uniref:Uncharacterized protein n=1 Tax=Pygocentrus nattereri TaxID=42514 RepID=A0A3B4DRQ7_PYGNA
MLNTNNCIRSFKRLFFVCSNLSNVRKSKYWLALLIPQINVFKLFSQTVEDSAVQCVLFYYRRRTALWCTVVLLMLSIVVLVIGLLSATRTGNVAVAGYYPGIILVASIIFVSLGVISCFFCAIVDGIIDRRPLMEGRCEFYASGSGYAYDNYYTEVTCQSFNEQCKLKVKSNTCYCCDLHSCESTDYHAHYFEFTGVGSCWDVVHLHRLLWSNVVLNVLGVFLGIVTAAILGAFKDMAPAVQTQMSPSPAPPPHILYNPTQHMLTYASFCPSGQALPAYPNYPMPMQVTIVTKTLLKPAPGRL